MPTQIPAPRITRTETGGFRITCASCPNFLTMRPSRPAADLVARNHQNQHAAQLPRFTEDQEW